MRKTTKIKSVLLASMFVASLAHAERQQQPQQPQKQAAKRVDLVIALDTSSSMDGLIDGARQKLWDVVNLLAEAKPTPVLRVGLISYGNTGYPSQNGWVRIDSELTTDLDTVNEKLFALRTNGGTEYVARAVRAATQEMKWDQDPSTLKIIFVAGNEPATQDPMFPVDTVVGEARQQKIYVNAIYCGHETVPEAMAWRRVAELGAGKFASIDHNRTVAIATPMDAELARLSGELNKTYLGYGSSGRARAANQVAQDENAAKAGGSVAAARAATKSSSMYYAGDWDLVDAKKKGKKVAEMPAAELPAPVAALPADKRDAFVEEKAKERTEIQKRITALNAEREKYIRAERSKKPAGPKGIDDALNESIVTQGKASGLAW